MASIFFSALQKVVDALESEKIDYMIVGEFAVSYHNRSRTTNDIDIFLQIKPHHIKKILQGFPHWKGYQEIFEADVAKGMMFNVVDFETGIRYDFMPFKDTEYGNSAFERRKKVKFFEVDCYMSSIEDLIISKFRWYNMSPSDKQMEDLRFLLKEEALDLDYLKSWIKTLNLKTYGLLGE